MSGWSVKTFDPLWGDEKVEVSYPNASGDSFWDSGNNSMTTSLCVADNGTACLTPSKTLGVAPGNLCTILIRDSKTGRTLRGYMR